MSDFADCSVSIPGFRVGQPAFIASIHPTRGSRHKLAIGTNLFFSAVSYVVAAPARTLFHALFDRTSADELVCIVAERRTSS
jgi:hypothetical protein